MVWAAEGAPAKANAVKALQWIMEVAAEGVAYMAILDGHLVGTIGIEKRVWRWSDEAFLGEQWLYVLPQHRSGKVILPALFGEVQTLCHDTGLKAYINVTNPNRQRGPMKGMARVAQIMGFSPLGPMIVMTPRDQANVLR